MRRYCHDFLFWYCKREGILHTQQTQINTETGFFFGEGREREIEQVLFQKYVFFPQIAITIGVLTSNRGGRATNHFGGLDVASVLLQGAVDVVPLLGPIVGCHCSVLWLGRRVTTNFGGVDVVPLQGATGGEGDDQLWGSGRGAIAGAIVRCHCVLWFG